MIWELQNIKLSERGPVNTGPDERLWVPS